MANDASSDRTPGPQQIVGDAGPPAYWLYTSSAGATPAWACVKVGTSPPTFLRVKLVASPHLAPTRRRQRNCLTMMRNSYSTTTKAAQQQPR